MDEKVRTLNALQYILTGWTSEVRYKKGRKKFHEKDEKAYWLAMELARKMRREIEQEGIRHETLDF